MKTCDQKSNLLKILPKSIHSNATEQNYEVISASCIPLSLDDRLVQVYEEQLQHGVKLPTDIKPEKYICINDYSFFDHKPARPSRGITIYTESDVIFLPSHQGNYVININNIYD